MAGYIGNKAVGLNVTTGDILGDVGVGGDIDVDGTANLDVVDIDGAVDMASTLQLDGAITLGVAGASNGFINSPSGIFVNIDSDNNQTDRFFDVRTNSADGSGTLLFQVVETGAATIANGLTLTDGNLTVASGHGIDFSVTGDGAGTDSSELLDDYEEGTWAPVLAGLNAGSSNGTYSVQVGTYTKVGRLINANFHIDIGSLNDGTGALTITGLPYASANIANNYGSMTVPHVSGWSGNYYNISGLVGANSSQMPIYYQAGNGNMVAATHAQLQEGNFLATIVYQTAS